MADVIRFPIRFEPAYAVLSSTLFLFPSSSYVEVDGSGASVRMGWAFRMAFERAQITGVEPYAKRVLLSRGVHGWGGRWLVNGSAEGVLSIRFERTERAYVCGFPIKLYELLVSVEDPDAVTRALTAGHERAR